MNRIEARVIRTSFQETIYNLVMALAFAVAAIFMFLFNASYWADRNPAWQPVPALASVSTYFIDSLIK